MEDLQRKYNKKSKNNSIGQQDKCDNHEKHDKCDDHEKHDKCDKHDKHDKCDNFICDCVCTVGNNCGCDLEICGDDCINVESSNDQCCKPLAPTKFDINNVVLYPVEVNRIFDTILFQTFTDPEDPIDPAFEVDEICGNCPPCKETEVSIDKVCLSYDDVEVTLEEKPVLDDYNVGDQNDEGDTFEFPVEGKLDKKCACNCLGNPCCFKQRGIEVKIHNLRIEIKGHFGNSEFTASANTKCVEFEFGKLSGELCCPADGKDFILREDIETLFSIDCVGKAKIIQHNGPNGVHYELYIPGGLDLVCCLQNKVSTLVSDQLSLVGSVDPIKPKLVDAFSNVCDFSCIDKKCVESVKPTHKCKC